MRPLAVLRAFWDSIIVIEEDADFLEAFYAWHERHPR